jgi:hypothetical protein
MIPLPNNEWAVIDEEDFPLVNPYSWCTKKGSTKRYVDTYLGKDENGKQKHQVMHRMITDAPKGMLVDHKNGNTYDNRRANLRVCTSRQNNVNRGGPQKGNRHGFKGIWQKNDQKRIKRWIGAVRVDGKMIYTGYYETPEEAASARDALAVTHYGEFASLNYPIQP